MNEKIFHGDMLKGSSISEIRVFGEDYWEDHLEFE